MSEGNIQITTSGITDFDNLLKLPKAIFTCKLCQEYYNTQAVNNVKKALLDPSCNTVLIMAKCPHIKDDELKEKGE